MKMLLFIVTLALAGCATTGAVFGPTPEAQIVTGANATTAAATLGTVLLKHDKITVGQAKSYSALLHAASTHLNDANKTLTDCRKITMSTEKTRPDPCAPTVAGDIGLALSIAAEVHRTLKAKE